MVDPGIAEVWANYLQAEESGVKEHRARALDLLIQKVLQQPEGARYAWALELARRYVDEEEKIPLRFPLIHDVLEPALIHGVLAKQSGCARWAAMLLPDEALLLLPEPLRSRESLLEEALRLDSSDVHALQRLIFFRANYLTYTLHELPLGVLYGPNGATIEQCGELMELLSRFRKDIERGGRSAQYAELVKRCAYHFEAYRTYLQFGSPSRTYQSFLEANPGPG